MDADRQAASLVGMLAPSDRLIEFMKAWEGPPHLAPREDPCVTGTWDYGYGVVCEPDAEPLTSIDAAVDLLRLAVNAAAQDVRAALTAQLVQHQFDAMVAWRYNVGKSALIGSTLLRLINGGDVTGAAAQFARWNMAGGKVVAGLVKRRAAEEAMFMRADYSLRP